MKHLVTQLSCLFAKIRKNQCNTFTLTNQCCKIIKLYFHSKVIFTAVCTVHGYWVLFVHNCYSLWESQQRFSFLYASDICDMCRLICVGEIFLPVRDSLDWFSSLIITKFLLSRSAVTRLRSPRASKRTSWHWDDWWKRQDHRWSFLQSLQ